MENKTTQREIEKELIIERIEILLYPKYNVKNENIFLIFLSEMYKQAICSSGIFPSSDDIYEIKFIIETISLLLSVTSDQLYSNLNSLSHCYNSILEIRTSSNIRKINFFVNYFYNNNEYVDDSEDGEEERDNNNEVGDENENDNNEYEELYNNNGEIIKICKQMINKALEEIISEKYKFEGDNIKVIDDSDFSIYLNNLMQKENFFLFNVFKKTKTIDEKFNEKFDEKFEGLFEYRYFLFKVFFVNEIQFRGLKKKFIVNSFFDCFTKYFNDNFKKDLKWINIFRDNAPKRNDENEAMKFIMFDYVFTQKPEFDQFDKIDLS